MEDSSDSELDIIISSILGVLILLPLLIIWINRNRVEHGRHQMWINNSHMEKFFHVAMYIFPIYHIYIFIFADDPKPPPEYKCNFCKGIFDKYSEYCPTCGKDNDGKYKYGTF